MFFVSKLIFNANFHFYRMLLDGWPSRWCQRWPGLLLATGIFPCVVPTSKKSTTTAAICRAAIFAPPPFLPPGIAPKISRQYSHANSRALMEAAKWNMEELRQCREELAETVTSQRTDKLIIFYKK